MLTEHASKQNKKSMSECEHRTARHCVLLAGLLGMFCEREKTREPKMNDDGNSKYIKCIIRFGSLAIERAE